MKVPEYARFDAIALARLVATGEVSARELVEAALTGLDAHDPALGALVRRHDELARRQAEAVSPGSSPLAGVPTLLKDLGVRLAGVPTGNGTRHLQNGASDTSSTCVQRLLDAGLTIVGQSNTAELGLSYTTEPKDLFPTRNPWDRTRTAGGSSGGSAAAVAAGIVPLAHASDGGGSIRVPASCCGLVGLKPSRGRVPVGPVTGEAWSGLAGNGVVSRSVRDTAAALDVMAGWEPGDPYAAPTQNAPYLTAMDHAPGRLRIALSTDWSAELPSAPACRAAAEDAGRLLENLGHIVAPAAPAFDRDAFRSAFLDVVGAHAFTDLNAIMQAAANRRWAPGDFAPAVEAIAAHGRDAGVEAHLHGRETLQRTARTVGRFLVDTDLFLTPTLAQLPPKLGVLDDESEGVWALHARQGAFSPFTGLANATGEPAISLPLFWSDGLPVGVMLHAPLGREDRLLQVARQCEQARPWFDARP
ncbi:amidase [Rhodovibrio salinarum]|nr:amidase family protein [Rhodovibrio salinarum]